MRHFDRYVFTQLLSVFGFFALVLVLVFWINRAVILLDRLLADGQSLYVFGQISLLTLPTVIYQVVPIAGAVAGIYVANRLSTDSELTVARATGFSPLQLTRAPALFALCISAFLIILSNLILPVATRSYDAAESALRQDLVSRFLTPGTFLTPTDDVMVYVRNVTSDGVLEDIFLSDARAESGDTTYTADTAYVIKTDSGPKLIMREGSAQQYDKATRGLIVTSFSDFVFDIGMLISSTPTERTISPDTLSTQALLAADQGTQAATGRGAHRLRFEGLDRYTNPGLGFVAAILGFTTMITASFRRTGAAPAMLGAVFMLIVVKLADTYGSNLAREEGGPLWAMFAGTYLGLVIIALQLAIAMKPGRKARRLEEVRA